MVRLETSKDVIDKLGGTTGVMALTGAKSATVVSNWRQTGFPPKFYLLMTQALADLNCEAPASLWRMKIISDLRPPQNRRRSCG